MTEHYDLAIVGAGPAGGNVALVAAQAGLDVVLLDEQPDAGGQVWRGKSASILAAPATPEGIAGDRLRADLNKSSVTLRPNTRVWDIRGETGAWHLQILRADHSEQIVARKLVLATGAREFVQPVPGWTTPGVVGLAGATALFKQTLSPPGSRTIVSGTGPLVFFVASEIRRLGGEVAAIVTPNSRKEWMRALPAMLSQPKLLMRGAVWMADLMLARIPILWSHTVCDIHGEDHVSSVATCDLNRAAAGPSFYADSLCLGHGLIPNIEAPQMLGVPIRHDPNLGGWVPEVDMDGVTAVPGLYLCGDGCGIRGVTAARLQGHMTGARIARDLGRSTTSPSARAWRRAERFGLAMTALSEPSAKLEKQTSKSTIICRCESLTKAEICSEIDKGAASANAVKSGRRAGMGPCSGKFCQTAVASLIAAKTGKALAEIPPPTPRPPLRPVPLGKAAGDFDYDDLPIPKPAPL